MGKLLIVLVHPEPRSTNACLAREAARFFQSAGWEVEVSDLYAQQFASSAGWGDFTAPVSPQHLVYAHEQKHAHARRDFAADILAEQDKLARADLVIFQFPLWWYAVPAMLKGWAERVLSKGFAYDDRNMFAHGLLKGKAAMLSMTTGGTEQELYEDRMHTGTLQDFMRPFTGGVLGFTGMTVLPPFIAYAVDVTDEEGRQALLLAQRRHLAQVLSGFAPAASA